MRGHFPKFRRSTTALRKFRWGVLSREVPRLRMYLVPSTLPHSCSSIRYRGVVVTISVAGLVGTTVGAAGSVTATVGVNGSVVGCLSFQLLPQQWLPIQSWFPVRLGAGPARTLSETTLGAGPACTLAEPS